MQGHADIPFISAQHRPCYQKVKSAKTDWLMRFILPTFSKTQYFALPTIESKKNTTRAKKEVEQSACSIRQPIWNANFISSSNGLGKVYTYIPFQQERPLAHIFVVWNCVWYSIFSTTTTAKGFLLPLQSNVGFMVFLIYSISNKPFLPLHITPRHLPKIWNCVVNNTLEGPPIFHPLNISISQKLYELCAKLLDTKTSCWQYLADSLW